jgi:hypothetical protein
VGESWAEHSFFLLITYMEIRYTHVGFQMGKDTPENPDLLQGILLLRMRGFYAMSAAGRRQLAKETLDWLECPRLDERKR